VKARPARLGIGAAGLAWKGAGVSPGTAGGRSATTPAISGQH
jgi:hypothetical protein